MPSPISFIYDCFRTGIQEGTYNFSTHSTQVALFTSAYTASYSDTSYSSLTGEVANGNGYSTGGINTTVSISITNHVASFTFGTDPFVWNPATITANSAVIYDGNTDNLIAYIYFGGDLSSDNQTFTLSWYIPSNTFITLQQG